MPTAFEIQLKRIPEHDRYRVEERAAMIEFEGKGCPRVTAENLALADHWRWKRLCERDGGWPT